MLVLQEYLGALVSNIAQARVLADVESAKIAGLYADDTLLKHFSIPRMRIEDVELTIPVAIQSVGQPTGTTPAGYREKLASGNFLAVLKGLHLTELPEELSVKVRTAILSDTEAYYAGLISQKEETLPKYAASIAMNTLKSLKIMSKLGVLSFEKEEDKARIVRQITQEVTRSTEQFLQRIPPGPLTQLQVITEAQKLKELPQSALVVIKMKITEEAMVWDVTENESGTRSSKLIPE